MNGLCDAWLVLDELVHFSDQALCLIFFVGERPYRCHVPECGRAFIQLSNLQQHLRNHDAQLERAKNRPFQCAICGKGFATESSLRTHTAKVYPLFISLIIITIITCLVSTKNFIWKSIGLHT